MKLLTFKKSCRAQSAIEILLIVSLVAVIIFIGYKKLLPSVSGHSRGIVNNVRDVIYCDTWNTWSVACSTNQCGMNNGTQTRTCKVCGGIDPCPDATIVETRSCSGTGCPILGETCNGGVCGHLAPSCNGNNWSAWSACSTLCGVRGSQTRTCLDCGPGGCLTDPAATTQPCIGNACARGTCKGTVCVVPSCKTWSPWSKCTSDYCAIQGTQTRSCSGCGPGGCPPAETQNCNGIYCGAGMSCSSGRCIGCSKVPHCTGSCVFDGCSSYCGSCLTPGFVCNPVTGVCAPAREKVAG